MKDEIKNSEKELQMMFDAAPVIMFLIDKDRKIRKSNFETSRILNKPSKDLIGLRGGDVFGCVNRFDDPKGCGFGKSCESCITRNTISDTLYNGVNHYKVEISVSAEMGIETVTKYFLLSTSRINNNKEDFVLVSVEDITDNKNNEIELENYKKQLELLVDERTEDLKISNIKLEGEIQKQKIAEKITKKALKKEKESNELIGQFIESASHEFRTPLTSILTSSEVLELFGKSLNDDEFTEQINRITVSVEQVTSLMDKILMLNETNLKQIKADIFSININSLCKSIIMDIEKTATSNHNLSFKTNLKRNNINLDEKLVRLIISNLLNNAVKYSPNGGNVNLSIEYGDEILKFIIKDEGIGISEKDKSKIFFPFSRAVESRSIPGTGLGLTIVKKSVDLLDGKIEFESYVNKGSMFTVQIPVK